MSSLIEIRERIVEVESQLLKYEGQRRELKKIRKDLKALKKEMKSLVSTESTGSQNVQNGLPQQNDKNNKENNDNDDIGDLTTDDEDEPETQPQSPRIGTSENTPAMSSPTSPSASTSTSIQNFGFVTFPMSPLSNSQFPSPRYDKGVTIASPNSTPKYGRIVDDKWHIQNNSFSMPVVNIKSTMTTETLRTTSRPNNTANIGSADVSQEGQPGPNLEIIKLAPNYENLFKICVFCGIQFLSPNHLLDHNKEKPFHCHKCDIQYCSSSVLKNHMRKCHPPTNTDSNNSGSAGPEEIEIHDCSLCPSSPRQFKKLAHLKAHVRRCHTDAI